jgi:DNA mismatch endonuclease (patch repair protein)
MGLNPSWRKPSEMPPQPAKRSMIVGRKDYTGVTSPVDLNSQYRRIPCQLLPSGPVAEMVASSPEVSARMSLVRNRDTGPELAVRRELHGRGLRYRVAYVIPSLGRIRPDIVFTRHKVVVFVDGCFWHSCPVHATVPRTNRRWWVEKLEANVRRDHASNEALASLGWTVIRVWSHEDPTSAADRIEAVVRRDSSKAH